MKRLLIRSSDLRSLIGVKNSRLTQAILSDLKFRLIVNIKRKDNVYPRYITLRRIDEEFNIVSVATSDGKYNLKTGIQ